MAGGSSDGVSSKTKHGRRRINVTLRRKLNQMRGCGITGIIHSAAADTLQQVFVETVSVGNRAGVIASQYLRELSTANGVTVGVLPNVMIERKHACERPNDPSSLGCRSLQTKTAATQHPLSGA